MEVASDRLLGMINKGVSVAKVAKVTDHFTRAGIMVHAYLMYGFPTQTEQETIDSLEVVRQLFEIGVVQSGFWHQFAMTAHSPVGLNPAQFKTRIVNEHLGTFANNDLIHTDPTGANHELFSEGLRKSLFNYMYGICFDFPLQEWFNFKVPRTKVAPDFIQKAIDEADFETASPHAKVYWLGGPASVRYFTKKKKNQTFDMAELTFFNKKSNLIIQLPQKEGQWLFGKLPTLSVSSNKSTSFSNLSNDFEEQTGNDFLLFWNSTSMKHLRENGLLIL